MVARLLGEESHDGIAISSNRLATYNPATYGTMNYAMLFPEPLAIPDGTGGNISNFLNSFQRGNRDDQPRTEDGSILQALNLMNNSFVMTRVSTTTPATGLLPASL